jgi:deoxyribonuclease IV
MAHSSSTSPLSETAFVSDQKKSFIDELERAEAIGAENVVLHPGAYGGAGVSAGIERLVENLDECLERSRSLTVAVALETTAGQGSYLGAELSQLRDMIGRSRFSERLGGCVDSCHIHAAGYDIVTAAGYEQTVTELAELIGFDRVLAWHLNDSMTARGSHRDRHAKLGEGTISTGPIRRIVDDSRWDTVPGCLETPGGEENWKREIDLLGSPPS